MAVGLQPMATNSSSVERRHERLGYRGRADSGRRAITNLLPRALEDPAKLRFFETPLVIVILSDEEDADIKQQAAVTPMRRA